MLITMKLKWFMVFFATFVILCKAEEADIDFVDCGSLIEVEKVLVNNCTSVPCSFHPGDNVSVVIFLFGEEINLDNTEISTVASILMYGVRWPLSVVPVNPCTQWRCPLNKVTNLTYTAEVQLDDGLMKRPGELQLKSAFKDEEDSFMCINISITLL